MKNLRRLAWILGVPLLLIGLSGCGHDDNGGGPTTITGNGLGGAVGGTDSSYPVWLYTITQREPVFTYRIDVVDHVEYFTMSDAEAEISGTVNLTSNFLVPEGSTLRIAPGTKIVGQGDAWFRVEGKIEAEGTREVTPQGEYVYNMIEFTTETYPRERGDWAGIILDNADDESVFRYVKISYASRYDLTEDTTKAVTQYIGSNPPLADAEQLLEGLDFPQNGLIVNVDSYEDSILVTVELDSANLNTDEYTLNDLSRNFKRELNKNKILDRGAITIRDCSPTIERCIIDYSGYDAIHVVGDASPVIKNNTMVMNAFNGIRIEPTYAPAITPIPENGTWGDPVIINNIIVENDDAGIRALSGYASSDANPTIMYNNIWNNASLNYIPSTIEDQSYLANETHLDPKFRDIAGGDYSLHPCSGSIDRGQPTAVPEEMDPDGTTPDQGVFAFHQWPNSLSHTLSGDKLNLVYPLTATLDLGGVQVDTTFEYYLVTCDVLVDEGSTIHIGEGVRIVFAEAFAFHVKGDIEAEGTPDAPIVFTSALPDGKTLDGGTPQRADWKNLFLDGVSTDSYLENVRIEYGSVDDIAAPSYSGALSLDASSPDLINVEINESYNTGLYLYNGSSPMISGLRVANAAVAGAIFKLNSSPDVYDAMLHDITGYGIQMERASSPLLRSVLIYNIGVSGIVLEQLCSPTIDHMTIYSSGSRALRAENLCDPVITNSIFSFYGEYGIEATLSSFPNVRYVNLFSEDGTPFTPLTMDVDDIVEGDPKFIHPIELQPGDVLNFDLQDDSPCKGAAPDGSDLGYYGGL